MPRKKGSKKHGVRSKKQWAWMFANKKPFAHKWAHAARYKSLPKSK